VGRPSDPARAVNIDTPADWARAEALAEALGVAEPCRPAGVGGRA
jgi:hypothetical protein